MIGALPRYAQAPLDYRYALDEAKLLAGLDRVAERFRILITAIKARQKHLGVAIKVQIYKRTAAC